VLGVTTHIDPTPQTDWVTASQALWLMPMNAVHAPPPSLASLAPPASLAPVGPASSPPPSSPAPPDTVPSGAPASAVPRLSEVEFHDPHAGVASVFVAHEVVTATPRNALAAGPMQIPAGSWSLPLFRSVHPTALA
jgi:hypothetical protein